jgi:hypothetical protein
VWLVRAIEPGWATRFYGMTVTPETAAAAHEHLTDDTIADLVDAHLASNYSYFGAIDKTLSGFVVLDDTGDDFTLLDLRDGGQIWWQDHETREVSLRHDKLGSDKPAKKPKGTRALATPALCARYQWLVWMLARPLVRDGVPQQATDYLVRGGIGRFRGTWPERDALEAAFEVERRELSQDPHLAIYWLLHATALCEDDRRARVIAEIGDSCELVRAFVARLGTLPLAGDLPVVPEFRARRALALAYGGFASAPEDVPRVCLRALEVSPGTDSLAHGLQVATALEKGTLDAATISQVLGRIPDVTPGTELVRAALDKRAGAPASRRADALATLLGTGDEPWWLALEALWHVHELAYDGAALVAATKRIVARDRFHRRALQMRMRAAQIAGEPIEAIEADLAIADGVLGPFTLLVDKPGEWEATIGVLGPLAPLRRGLAWRVLQRAQINKPVPAVFAWAADKVLSHDGAEGAAVVGQAFAQLDLRGQPAAVAELAKGLDGADDPRVAALLSCLEAPEPPEHDHGARFALSQARGKILEAIAPYAHDAVLFVRLMALVERPASGAVVDAIWGKLFSPFEEASFVLPRLDGGQAVRVARAMIVTCLRHPQIHARSSAGHQLYRFAHVGAQDFLIDALTDYGVRFAAKSQDDDRLEDLVANLYAAVRNLDTPAAREALIERLFAERRAYWRMASAIGDAWSPELHARALALLAERRDARAAGCYAYALADFVKKPPPLVELTRMICDWQGDTEVARGFLHYALAVGEKAALDEGDHELVRRAHEAAAWIAEKPLEPDDYARGRGWKNPLEEPAVAALLARVLAGEAAAGLGPRAASGLGPRASGLPRGKKKPTAKPKARVKPKAKAKPKPKPKPKTPKPKAAKRNARR